jgi:hypothetical protein
MKIQKSYRAASSNFRALTAVLLCLMAVIMSLFAFTPLVQQKDDRGHVTAISRWLTRLASSVGIEPRSQAAGAIKLDKDPAERPAGATPPPAGPYSSDAVNDLRGVTPVRSGKLSDMTPINPDLVPKIYHQEPIRPRLPAQSGRPQGPIQTVMGRLASAPSPTGLNFEGVGVGLGGFSPASNPPDVNGRVGATQYVQWNNASFAVFNKTTGALQYGPAAGNTLFQALGGACAAHNDGDPVVSYDILAGRWVLSQFVVDGGPGSYSHQCFAVSATSDATGEYYLYDFTTDPVNFVDYPHTGVWPDGYYMSAHVFNPAGTFTTGRIYVFERDKMILGQTARMQSQNLGTEFGFLPADLDSLTPPAVGEASYLIGPNFALTELTDNYRVATTWGATPTLVVTPGAPIDAGLGNAPCLSGVNSPARDCVPEPPPATGPDYLDNLSGHYMYRLAYRNQGTQALPLERLVVSGPSDSSDANHGAVEWFEFRNAGSSTTQPTLFQSGIYDPDTSYRWMSSIAMDKDGNIALGYSKSSTTVIPGVWVTGRLATDAPGIMGAEVQMQSGLGVQIGGGNRWGDYSAMTLDPIDQCTFYYTNEYLKTNGAFNWSTRIAAFKFASCVSAAGVWGTVTGTITSSQTGLPIPGVTVMLSNGYAGASNASGIYTILVPAGSYSATATDPKRNCTSSTPASAPVAPTGGGTVTQNFQMTGASKLEGTGATINDSLGNNNGIVNRGECILLNLGVKNNGCAGETAISSILTTTTPGVTVVNGSSAYPNMPIDAGGTNTTPFKISLADTFACGTDVVLSLNLTYAGGTKSIPFTIPTCGGGPDQQIPSSQITTSDSSQPDRMGRDGRPSICFGKTCPAAINTAGTRNYKTFTFTNSSGAPRCFTVTINAALGGEGDIQSAAYQTAYTPPVAMGDPTGNMCLNYLGDSGISGLGTTVGTASYSFTVPAQTNFVVVVNTVTGSTNSSVFSGTVSGFINDTAGPGACTAGSPTPTATATATPVVTATPTATPIVTATPTATATTTPIVTATPTATATVTPIVTATPTATATTTPIVTATPSATATATPIETATPTATATATPVGTPTPTPIPGTLLDTITGADTSTFTSSPPRTYMGDGWTNNTIPAGSTQVRITALTLYMVSTTTQAYTDVVARIQFWNTYNQAATPVFSNSSGPLVTVDLGSMNLAANSITAIPVTLATPLTLPGGPGTNWGFAQNFQGNTGAGLGDTTNLTSLLTAHSNGQYSTGQITTGTAPTFGYYRNASARTDFNFDSADFRTLGLNAQGIGIVIFGTAQTTSPTPTATATPSATATPTATAAPAARALNLSTRLRVDTGDNAGIGGLIVTGSVPKRVIIRALGPSLAQFGFPASELLADPTLELHGPGTFFTITNNNWRDTQEAEITASGLAPTNNLESAIIATLQPGAYTAVVRGNGTGVGVGLVEVYDLDSAAASRLGNLSTRAFVRTGNNVVIAGFILGNGTGNDRVVVRGLGPSLSQFGVSNPLQDPKLELRDQNGTLLRSNNDWADDPAQAAEITAAGLAPTSAKESAIAATLPPGLYTAILAGTNATTGVGIVEVYDRGGGP